MARVGSFDDMKADEIHGVYDFTVDGKCSGCGECCSNFLPIASSEIKAIKRYIEKYHVKEQKRFAPLNEYSLDMTCPFRSDSERRCLIYPVRPEICKVFMCNHSKEDIRRNKNVMNKRYDVVDMRHTFYGHSNSLMDLICEVARSEARK